MPDDFSEQGLDKSDPNKRQNSLYWRAVYRASKSLAAFSAGGTAYVYMKPNNCRNIFSPASQSPKDNDPAHGGQATNGEVWYYSELPMLMRNLRINKIIAFDLKVGAAGTSVDDFSQDTQWDAQAVRLRFRAQYTLAAKSLNSAYSQAHIRGLFFQILRWTEHQFHYPRQRAGLQ